jgi:hypothetical protein
MGLAHTCYAGRYLGPGGSLLCQDCHTTVDLQGDGNMAAAHTAQRKCAAKTATKPRNASPGS